MKRIHRALALLFAAGCMMNGCTQDKLPTEAPLPEEPSIATGVLRTNIDGIPWEAQDAAGIPSGTATYNGNILHITGTRSVAGDTAEAETIDLFIDLTASKATIGPGTYGLGSIPAQQGEAELSDGVSSVCHTDNTHAGTVTIQALDVARKAVSGIFAFKGIGVDGQTHIFSEGMFDVTWKAR